MRVSNRTARVTGTLFFALLFMGCSGSSFDVKDNEKEGYAIYQEYCDQCHRLQNPSLHTAEQWPKVVERMHKHMVEMKRNIISPEQTEKLLVFLRGHAAQ